MSSVSKAFAALPKEIVHHILEYDSTVCFRNGEYINRIPVYDPRYQLLKRIPEKFRTSARIASNEPEFQEISVYIRFDNRNLLLLKQKYAYGKYIHYGFINRGDNRNIRITDYKMAITNNDDE